MSLILRFVEYRVILLAKCANHSLSAVDADAVSMSLNIIEMILSHFEGGPKAVEETNGMMSLEDLAHSHE